VKKEVKGKKPPTNKKTATSTRDRGATKRALEAATAAGYKRPVGRPRDSDDVWTPEHIEEVADAMWTYIQETPCPSLAEMCYKLHLRHQRISEHRALMEMRDELHAKRLAFIEKQGMALTKDDGSRGTFLIKMAANVGQFSFVERQELEHSGSIGVQIVDDVQ